MSDETKKNSTIRWAKFKLTSDILPTTNEISVDTFSALHRANIIPRPNEFSELKKIDIDKHVLKFSVGHGESHLTKNRYKKLIKIPILERYIMCKSCYDLC